MKIGIYLGYGPQTLLHKEGLGRYLATLIKGLTDKEEQVTVALPKWLVDSFELLAEDFQIDIKKMNFIIEYNTPVIWQIYIKLLDSRKPKRNLKKKLLLSSIKAGEFCFGILLSTTNIFVLLLLGILGIVLGILLLPFGILGVLLYACYHLLRMIKKKEKTGMRSIAKKIEVTIQNVKGSGYRFYSKVFHKVLENVQERLVRRINRQGEKMDIWYSPGIFWPCFNKIKGNRVINVPDLVVMDYPLHWYNEPGVIESALFSEQTIVEGCDFITYCEYIRDELLVKRYGKKKENIAVIPHMVNDMSQYVTIDAKVAAQIADSSTFTKAFCRMVLGQLKTCVLQMNEYINKFDFQDVRYIFYSSQARPHKNLINLLRAYQHVLRKRYGEVKLFVTGDLYHNEETRDYILNNKLQYDVLCFYNVNSQQLAALYHEADLVINPTLYEGGFPFTFGEGMSVGVPSLMSNIPQIREVFSGELEECLFDPFDYMSMAGKLEWGLKNKKYLFELQYPLYKKMCMRSGNCYVEEYLTAFTDFIK